MKQGIFEIESNEKISKDVYRMILLGDASAIKASGQFINIKLEGMFLRRPISVCDYTEESITILYKVVGVGTEQMSSLKHGCKLDILTGLGNGYDTSVSGEKPVLIGGGVGIPPLYNLAKKLVSEGKTPIVVLGFNKKEDIFLESEFKDLGVGLHLTTRDGSRGACGFVTDAIKDIEYTYFYTCGPEPMLRAVYENTYTNGQFSFEERMGCGFGACMGCTCKTKYGNKRICKEGPVLLKEEIIW